MYIYSVYDEMERGELNTVEFEIDVPNQVFHILILKGKSNKPA